MQGHVPYDGRDSNAISLREWVHQRFTDQQRALELLANDQQRALELLASTSARETHALSEQVDRVANLHADAHAREHTLYQEAILKAEVAVERRLAAMNEFRGQLSDQATTFARRDMVDEKLDAMLARFERSEDVLDKRLTMLEQNAANMAGRMWAIGAGFAFLVVLVNIGLRWLPS